MPITPQANTQRNAITSALMNIANPPPAKPQLPQMAAATLPQQQPLGTTGTAGAMAMPGAMPQGMPQDPAPGQPGAFPTPATPATAPLPFTPMTTGPGTTANTAQGMTPQAAAPQPQAGRGY